MRIIFGVQFLTKPTLKNDLKILKKGLQKISEARFKNPDKRVIFWTHINQEL